MMKKKILVPIFGAVVLGLSAYVGYRKLPIDVRHVVNL